MNTRKDKRLSTNVDGQLSNAVKEAAAQLNISVSAFVEGAVCAELGRVDTLKENADLRKCRRKLEKEVSQFRTECDRLSVRVTDMTEQRDEFEKKLHAETDAYNKCYETSQNRKQQLAKTESEIKALWGRGIVRRFFNLKPKQAKGKS